MKRLLCIIFLLLLSVGMLLPAYAEESGQRSATAAIGDCQYRWGDSPVDPNGRMLWLDEKDNFPEWKPFRFPGKPANARGDRYIWVRMRIPETGSTNPVLLLRMPQQAFVAYIDGMPVYHFGEIDPGNRFVTPGSIWHFIKLPDKSAGKYVVLRVYSPFPDYAGYILNLRLGMKTDLVLEIIGKEIYYLILAGIFIFIGLILAFIFIMRREPEYIYLGLFSLFVGVWLIAESKLLQFFFLAPVLPVYIAIVAIFLAPVAFCAFAAKVFKNGKPDMLAWMRSAFLGFVILALLLDALRIVSIFTMVRVFHALLLAAMLITLFIIGREAVSGNRDAKLFLAGIIVLCLCSVHDIYSMFYAPSQNHYLILYAPWGMLAFVLSLVMILTRRIIDIYERMKLDSRESVERYRTLVETVQEGIGITDMDGRITYCNPKFAQIMGISQDRLLGKTFLDFADVRCREMLHEKMKLRAGNGSVKYEIVINTENGGNKSLLISESRYAGPSGNSNGMVVAVSDITERMEKERIIWQQAYTDSVTGLYNRAFFEAEMERIGKDLSRYKDVSIISIDIDGLKIVNDTLGHKVGDELLVEAARIISGVFRKIDIAARVGGDEFCIILPGASIKTAVKKRDAIFEKIESFNGSPRQFYLSMSIGVAALQSDDSSIYEVFKRADDNMYQYKFSQAGSIKSHAIDMLLAALAERDYVSQGHIERLVKMSEFMAENMKLSYPQKQNLVLLAKMHDIGKIGIPDEILFKPGALTDREYERMKEHVKIGYNIASRSKELSNIAMLILYHHERWDGKGYPKGLKGEEIPLECRILSIIDSFDAMTNQRPYNTVMSRDDAVGEIIDYSGLQFDPTLVTKFIKLVNSRGDIFSAEPALPS